MAGFTLAVDGRVETSGLGSTLTHEHVLVDFVGADRVDRRRYDPDEVFRVALPHLRRLRGAGCRTLLECTPAYLGRDPMLLRRLSSASGLRIVTNTGYYGAAADKYVPRHAWKETAEELAARWTSELEDGIEGTGVRPGFIKTGVDAGPLSPIDRKLVRAAALCHRRTGLTIAVHTDDGEAARGVVATLDAEGVSPEAYVWVHAQKEPDRRLHARLARRGVWLSFDDLGPGTVDRHVSRLGELKAAGLLGRVLVSHDAGWYHVGEAGGGAFRGYAFLFETLIPRLRSAGMTEDDVATLVVDNPARAFAIQARLVG